MPGWGFFISTIQLESSSAPQTKPLCVRMQLQLPWCPTQIHDPVWTGSGLQPQNRGKKAAATDFSSVICLSKSLISFLDIYPFTTIGFLLLFAPAQDDGALRACFPAGVPPSVLGLFHFTSKKTWQLGKSSSPCQGRLWPQLSTEAPASLQVIVFYFDTFPHQGYLFKWLNDKWGFFCLLF